MPPKGLRTQRKTRAVHSEKAELLLEIGTEELPYQFISPALRALAESAERELKDRRLAFEKVHTFGTPRRLTLAVEGVAAQQTSAVKEAMGPSKAVAFDATGQSTKAALGFAASHGLAVGQLESRHTPKGEYVFAVKRDPGRPASVVLQEMLPGLIVGLSFPKAMKWNATGLRFARPIRWIVALYGGRVVPCEVGGVKAGARTWGHRFMGTAAGKGQQGLVVTGLSQYLDVLRRQGVVPLQETRRTMILEQIETLAKSVRGTVHRDEDLLEQAVNAVEYPHPVLGSFDEAYLALPQDILVTAMKEHQGYFSLVGPNGRLLPQFIAITNMKAPNMTVIRRGNERVLAARLSDAKFYFDEDGKMPLADRAEKLNGVTFHHKLGTLLQKTRRLEALAGRLVMALNKPELAETARRAARLSKADLLTGVVGEFPALQGVMGGEYARLQGESSDVCRALAEHYLPKSMEDALPTTLLGMVVGLADRLDSIAAFFSVGMAPSGSEDPFALRRHAGGLVRMVLEGKLRLDVGALIGEAEQLVAREGFKATTGTPEERRRRIFDFLLERLRFYGRTQQGLRNDVMEAVAKSVRSETCDLLDLFSRMQAIQAITGRPEFDPLMVGFKRAHRLVEKETWNRVPVDASRFQHPSEGGLQQALGAAAHAVPAAVSKGRYQEALESLVRMKGAIDEFFAGVMVNAEDPHVRANRLSLLADVDRLFLSLADFSQIVVAGA
ncbi:MAG: glycine--tRNA ligase subunit beta [Nitrospira sp.]|nr:MAG: glycine--tRNA ligase subunit beta [Nitrospira sp.]